MNLIRWLYEPKRKKIGRGYDLIVPLDYANLTGDEILPDATYKCLIKAADLFKSHMAERIEWANGSVYGVSAYVLNYRKSLFVQGFGLVHDVSRPIECTNTIDEAGNIVKRFPKAKSVIIICDWRHARRALVIWKRLFKGEIAVVTVDGQWDKHHEQFWCRSNLRFLILNLAHHVVMKVVGVERMRRFRHGSAH